MFRLGDFGAAPDKLSISISFELIAGNGSGPDYSERVTLAKSPKGVT